MPWTYGFLANDPFLSLESGPKPCYASSAMFKIMLIPLPRYSCINNGTCVFFSFPHLLEGSEPRDKRAFGPVEPFEVVRQAAIKAVGPITQFFNAGSTNNTAVSGNHSTARV